MKKFLFSLAAMFIMMFTMCLTSCNSNKSKDTADEEEILSQMEVGNGFISYAVNYAHPDLKSCFVNFNPKNQEEIIEARTFGFYKDLKKFQLLGFAQGVTVENTIGLKDEGYTTNLRSEKEPVKHKLLDLVGDFYLTGVNPLDMKCQILAKEAGHAVHIKVAKMLKDKLIECK